MDTRSAVTPLLILEGETMGTTWSVRLVGAAEHEAAALRAGADAVLARIVKEMSHYAPDSDLSRFNGAPAGTVRRLPADFCRVLACALRVARASAGAFDPTVAPLVALWGFGPVAPRFAPPEPEVVAATRMRVGWWRIAFDAGSASLFQPGGLSLDFSGIAKGYAVDALVAFFEAEGYDDFLVEIGGELRGKGSRPDGTPWRIAVAAADDECEPDVLALRDLAVATSGDAWHGFEHDGQRYSHTLDPRTGWPVPHTLAQVTVVHASCMEADALATALGVLGPEAGLPWATTRGLAVRFVCREAAGTSVKMSPAFEALL